VSRAGEVKKISKFQRGDDNYNQGADSITSLKRHEIGEQIRAAWSLMWPADQLLTYGLET
jgi:hypothetical protein